MNTDPPNILFVFSDQHRWKDLGCYGNPEVLSPHLDRFAAGGLLFQNCFSNCPLCVPARGTLLTGLLPRRHGAIGNDLPIRHDVTGIAGVLSGAGYHTGYIGKWHLAGVPREQHIPPGPGRLGFSSWKAANCTHDYLHSHYYDEGGNRHVINGYEPTTQTDLAIDFIREQSPSSQPWALWLSWGPPHDPYRDVPKKWLDLYDPEELILPDNIHFPVNENTAHSWDEQKLRSNLQGYYAHISALDHEFGRLMDALASSGVEANTLVIYTSDHGDMLGSHGYSHKQLPYEESVHVPLLMRWPVKIPPGKRNQLIGLCDLPSTILGTLDISFPNPVDGENLSSLLLSDQAPGRDHVYLMEYTRCHQATDHGIPAWRAVRTASHLYAKKSDGTPWLFYNIQEDPLQKNNLLGQPGMRNEQNHHENLLDEIVNRHDGYWEPDELIHRCGLVDAWNISQRAFNRPEIAADFPT